jgi:hypothetical protein
VNNPIGENVVFVSLTSDAVALTFAPNFINAFTSSTLLFITAVMSGVSPPYMIHELVVREKGIWYGDNKRLFFSNTQKDIILPKVCQSHPPHIASLLLSPFQSLQLTIYEATIKSYNK